MLINLSIQNFTLIDKLDLDCPSGLIVITGETGAGKSLLLDALGIVLGGRAEQHLVRPGHDHCSITASFDIRDNITAKAWLEAQAIPAEDICLLRRHMTREGRSRHFINGQPVSLQSLRTLGAMFVNLHRQHEHQALLQTDAQRNLLDEYAQNADLKKKVAQLYHDWHRIQKIIEQQSKELDNKETQLSFLEFQAQEFEQLNISKEEIFDLNQDQKILAYAEQRIHTYQQLLATLEDQTQKSILQQLHDAIHLAQTLPTSPLNELFETARIQIEEALQEIHSQSAQLEVNPERLQRIEERLAKLHALARKHRVKLEELPNLHQQLCEKLENLRQIDQELERLKSAADELNKAYQEVAQKLTKNRSQAAKKMSIAITQHIQSLGMPGGKFTAEIIPYADNTFSPHGMEKIEFYVSINPGQPLKPLAKVASGGELSRISLAIQVIAAKNHPLPTMIFDEVDVGIGGNIAAIVGKLLCQLAQNTQIICITHLPQVAAQGKTHWQARKTVLNDQTTTQIHLLSEQEKVQEIARMLSGLTITKQTLAHAKELIMEKN